jgi:hypothetical protein
MSDLRQLIDRPGPFLTLVVPARSDVVGASDRFETQVRNALKGVPDEWDPHVDDLHAQLAALDHAGGAALIAIRSFDGNTFHEFIDQPIRRAAASAGPLPRLAPLLEARQRIIAHVVVATDLAGADLIAFDGGTVTATAQVDGDTEYIHRGHPGGWSQRRFQQRAENTWEENTSEVAEEARRLADSIAARAIFVVGPTRAQSMVTSSLSEMVRVPVHAVSDGSLDGATEEILRLTSDVAASDTVAVLKEFDERPDRRTSNSEQVVRALDEGRVETLLVHDDQSATSSDFIDHCIAQALSTHAEVRVVPSVGVLDHGVAAILRW